MFLLGLAVDETGRGQFLEVVGQGGRGYTQPLAQLTHVDPDSLSVADRARGTAGGQALEQSQAVVVSQRLEPQGDLDVISSFRHI